ncbi:GNAT family N-acetyltransferase [Actinomadura atramentaria]|uniref:GNAT family N-acetyltransferase n=1 Tax=Actinomadura atramentaria TaxID=1990 RepID=UPI0003676E44|nr:GNAT family N-acetyltransferase [Actinomadura atramentaria]
MATDDVRVRAAEPRDLAGLAAIEASGDAMFRRLGIEFPPGPMVVERMIQERARILVAGDPPVGFAAVEPLDGAVHLEQISVDAAETGRGIGTALLRAVIEEASNASAPGVSLITFREVPWNGPWYARHGFAELPIADWGPGLRRYWAAEIAAGLHGLGPRTVMWRPTG